MIVTSHACTKHGFGEFATGEAARKLPIYSYSLGGGEGTKDFIPRESPAEPILPLAKRLRARYNRASLLVVFVFNGKSYANLYLSL
jgi:hypothetical protein